MADVKALFNQCWTNSFQIRSIQVPGWTMGTIVCTPKNISTSWRLTDTKVGRLSWMNFGLKQYQLINFKVDVDSAGTGATGSMEFKKIPMKASKPRMSADDLANDLKEIQQSTGLSFQYSRQTMYDPPNRPDGSKPANQKAYTYFSFSAVSPYAPQEWVTFFEKFSGLEILKLEYTPSGDASNKWKYEGRIYAE